MNIVAGALSLLLGLPRLQQRLARRRATVSFIDHALLALVERFARCVAAVPFIDHALSSGRDGSRHRSHERNGSESGQQRGMNGKRLHLFTFQVWDSYRLLLYLGVMRAVGQITVAAKV